MAISAILLSESKSVTSSVEQLFIRSFKRRRSLVSLSQQTDIFTFQIPNPVRPPFNDSTIAVNSIGKINQVSLMFSVGYDLSFTPSPVLCLLHLICPSRHIPLQLNG